MVSVVIPLYNVEAYIGRCLDSVLGQSYNDIEIVVVDDCSTDGSVTVVEQYCGEHPNIRMIHHDRNRGPMIARQNGCMAATGDYVMFVDSDDVMPRDAVAGLVSRQRSTDADIVIGNALVHNVDGSAVIAVGFKQAPQTQVLAKLDVVLAVIESRVCPAMWGKLYRRELFQDGSLQTFERMTCAEDLCMIYQLAVKVERVVAYDGIVYEYWRRKGSLTVDGMYGVNELEHSIIAYKMMNTAFTPPLCAVLQEKLQRRLTYLAFRLYTDTVGVGFGTVRRMLRKYGMQQYGSIQYARKYLGIKDFYYFVKRYVYVRTVLKNRRK